LRPREILGLIGPNGAGKSTTFALISGALSLSSGEVMFRGEPIGNLEPYEIARRGVGRTFQHVKLIAQMSVLDNVALGAYLRGEAGVIRAALRLDRAEEARTRAAAAHAIACTGLAAHMFDAAGSLPLGKQRIAEIARALAADPVLLLLAEPAGKTTLLSATIGLLPSRGDIDYEGASLTTLTVEERVAAGLVLVPEKRELFAGMTVAENLELGAFARRRSRDAMSALNDVYRRF